MSRRHEVGVRVRVEARGADHKVHDCCGTAAREKLERWCCASTFVPGVDVGDVPVDVATGREATDEDDSTVSQRFCSRVPAHFLHGQHGGVVEPLTSWG